MNNQMYDVRQAADLLGVSTARIRQFCRDGRLGVKIGARWIITRADLERFKAIPRRTGRPPERGEDEPDDNQASGATTE